MKNLLAILSRRKFEATIVAMIVLVAGISATFLLPVSYRSTATVLVEQQESVKELLGSGQSAYADRRLKILSKQVLSGDNLNRVAKEFNLFDEEAYIDDRLLLSVLEDLKKSIDIDMINAEIIDSKARFKVEAAIAFNVSFIYKNPLVAQQVTERLVQLFFDENRTYQSKSTTAAADFLQQKENQLALKVEQLEDNLKEFKKDSIYTHPDMKDVNIRALEKVNDEASATRIQLRALQENRIYLESELIRISPDAIAFDSAGGRVLGNEDRLKVLRAEYAAKKARYSALHPDLARISREISSLESSTEENSTGRQIRTELKKLNSELKALQGRYSSSHPTTLSLKRQISSLKVELKNKKTQAQAPLQRKEADNPAYISTASKLKSAELEIVALNDTLAQLQLEREHLDQRLEKMPAVEREFVQLERDYQQTLEELATIRKKRFAAQLAGSLEESTNIQGLTILEPAYFPEKRYKPNRKLLLAVTLVLAGWAAFGIALIREHFDDRIWTTDDVAKELSEPPLSVIPIIKGRLSGATQII